MGCGFIAARPSHRSHPFARISAATASIDPRFSPGSVALSLCAATHPLYTRFTNVFGASISETAMRPNPRFSQRLGLLDKVIPS
jgi:hypothetical protein